MKNICFAHCVDVIGGAERVSQAIMWGISSTENNLYLAWPALGELATSKAQQPLTI